MWEGSSNFFADMGEEGVKNIERIVDVFYGWSLIDYWLPLLCEMTGM